MRPTADSLGAALHANQFRRGLHAAVTLAMALHRAALGGPVRPPSNDVRLFRSCTVLQVLTGMALMHILPRVLRGA